MTNQELLLLVPYLAATYLIGAIPFGLLVHRLHTGKDIREVGSGNIGATNVLRGSGKGMAILTLLLDVLKGFVPTLVACFLWSAEWVPALSALVAVLGHCFPVYLRFRGGKGVAAGLGGILGFAPLAALCLLGLFLVAVVPTRYASVGSILAGASTWIVLWLFGFGWPTVVLGAATGFVIVYCHRSNLVALFHGRERKIGGAS